MSKICAQKGFTTKSGNIPSLREGIFFMGCRLLLNIVFVFPLAKVRQKILKPLGKVFNGVDKYFYGLSNVIFGYLLY